MYESRRMTSIKDLADLLTLTPEKLEVEVLDAGLTDEGEIVLFLTHGGKKKAVTLPRAATERAVEVVGSLLFADALQKKRDEEMRKKGH